jgi:hypothetical protein
MRPTIEFNAQPLRDALKEYMRHTSRSLPEILQKQAAMLISGSKSHMGLYQEARTHAPATMSEIASLPAKLKWRIKRKAGGGRHSAIKEIRRRLRFAGYVQSTGWFNLRYGKKTASGAPRSLRQVSNPRGKVIENLAGFNPYITLRNITKGAGEFAQKTGYVNRAVANRAKDMMVYVDNKMKQAAARAKLKAK